MKLSAREPAAFRGLAAGLVESGRMNRFWRVFSVKWRKVRRP
jgi:hypothetical protein